MQEKLGNRRVTGAEQYYTPFELALELAGEAKNLIPDWDQRSFLEPAGGTGSFIEALLQLGAKSVTSVDTEPKHPLVKTADFLKFDAGDTEFVTISNPPFGRNNALSVPFFNHAAKFSSHIAFLVPRSWRKWSVTNRLDLNFHKIFDLDVQVVYQDQAGQQISGQNQLRTCFQIWEKRIRPRERIVVPDNHLVRKVTPERADVAIRVFGYGCGKVLRTFDRSANTTVMFLAVSEPAVIDALEGLDYERFINSTAYTQALSLQEINFLLNERFYGSGMHQKGLN